MKNKFCQQGDVDFNKQIALPRPLRVNVELMCDISVIKNQVMIFKWRSKDWELSSCGVLYTTPMLLAQECQLVWKSKKIKAGDQIILDTILLHQIGTKYREIFCLSVLRVPWSLYQPLISEGEIEPPFLACYW